MIMMFGVVLYNEILVIPFFGFNANTKIALIKRGTGSHFSIDMFKLASMASNDPR
jgi:hypothetical protein